ncbi:MAG: RNB domain-containing ribonuclease [Arcanobacterium sp.]|nr:RNB domain-containing ribonuclease [Arcanobacterium sp.]
MPKLNIKSNSITKAVLAQQMQKLREEFEIPNNFPDEVIAEAEAAANLDLAELNLPDYTHIPLVTIDPEGSRDLDQALYIENTSTGMRIYYAIAALNFFVRPGGALDQEVWRRGTTIYLPDAAVPLHPEVISTNAASLLPNLVRPAYLWVLDLDVDAELVAVDVFHARVSSRAQLSYDQVQRAVDGLETLPNQVTWELPQLLADFGKKRLMIERKRGGVSLRLPEQRIAQHEERYHLEFRDLTEVESWNAQVSLLTGMAAAQIMLKHDLGLLRTLPEADSRDIQRLRRVAAALGLTWEDSQSYGEFLATLDVKDPRALAYMNKAASLFRGAAYLALPASDIADDGRELPVSEDSFVHHAIAAPYAHVTAPLRRLVDRYGLEVVRCAQAGLDIPEWVLKSLPELNGAMATTGRIAGRAESQALNAVEALVLQGREGKLFDAVIIEKLPMDPNRDSKYLRGVIMIENPAIEAVVTGEKLNLGAKVKVKLDRIDLASRKIWFHLA